MTKFLFTEITTRVYVVEAPNAVEAEKIADDILAVEEFVDHLMETDTATMKVTAVPDDYDDDRFWTFGLNRIGNLCAS